MSNVNFTPPNFLGLNFSKLLIIAILFLSSLNVVKALPNVDAEILSITNIGVCDPATVVAGITPASVVLAYDGFYIESIQLYVRDEKIGGIYQDRLIASAGRQPDWQTSVTFNNIHGLGFIKAIITIVVDDTTNGGTESGTWTYESDLYTDETLIALQNPSINSMVINGATGGTNPYELIGCSGASYDLEFDLDYTFNTNYPTPTATFEIIEINSCGGGDISVVESYSFNELSSSDPFIDEFLAEMNNHFKSFVQNNTGLYRLRLTMGAGECGSGDSKQICVDISDMPSFDKLLLIKNDQNPSTPVDTVPAPISLANKVILGGSTGGFWAELSSSDYHYFRVRLQYDSSGTGFLQHWKNIPLVSQYSTNNTNVGGVLTDQFNSMMVNLSDWLVFNIGQYRVFLTVGVNGCTEDSTVGYFEITDSSKIKSAIAHRGSAGNKQSNVTVFPTPTSDKLTILNGTSHIEMSYSIMSLNGKLMQSGTVNQQTSVDVSHLTKGIYFIRCRSSDGQITHTQKIIKQ